MSKNAKKVLQSSVIGRINFKEIKRKSYWNKLLYDIGWRNRIAEKLQKAMYI